MSIFGKKKDEKNASCRCEGTEGGSAAGAVSSQSAGIKVLGSGCAKCNALEAAVKEALTGLGMDTAIDHVTDFSQIAAYGVMTTPALVIDGKAVSCGKVLSAEEIKALLKKARG